jgi:hypothetical protein
MFRPSCNLFVGSCVAALAVLLTACRVSAKVSARKRNGSKRQPKVRAKMQVDQYQLGLCMTQQREVGRKALLVRQLLVLRVMRLGQERSKL